MTGDVTGHFIDALGEPLAGTVSFVPQVRALLGVATVLPSTISVDLVDGSFTLALAATDDPAYNPPGEWTYMVSFRFAAALYASFSIEVPGGALTDLSTVAPVPSASGKGVTRGASAYEVWLTEGNTGTVQTFFDSLKATPIQDPARLGIYTIGA